MSEEKQLTAEQDAAWLTVEKQRDICMEAVKGRMAYLTTEDPVQIGRLAVDTFFAAALRVHELRRLHQYE
jgi:hypothetical protein